MKPIFLLFAVVSMSTSGCSQSSAKKSETKKYTNVGGSCEGCEGVQEYTTPVDSLKSMIWLPDWNERGRKIAVNGVVYKPNGEPAPNVLIYIYIIPIKPEFIPPKETKKAGENVMVISAAG